MTSAVVVVGGEVVEADVLSDLEDLVQRKTVAYQRAATAAAGARAELAEAEGKLARLKGEAQFQSEARARTRQMQTKGNPEAVALLVDLRAAFQRFQDSTPQSSGPLKATPQEEEERAAWWQAREDHGLALCWAVQRCVTITTQGVPLTSAELQAEMATMRRLLGERG